MRLLLLQIFLLASIAVAAQHTVTGKVQDDEGHLLHNASITITTVTNQTLAFGFTNTKGEFSITYNTTAEDIVIHLRKMDHQFIADTIQAATIYKQYILPKQYTVLKEVVVKNPAIYKRGDTINYSISEFADKGDRTIGDVLSKIPGIDVGADGTVSYQGRPIQKYYIEGLDLLEGKYGLANKNLPHNAVTTVQVLENHQPLRVLDSLVPSDQASLNIKLKKDITVSGNAQLGAGVSPLLWEANITPMLFTRKHQMIASYQSNNTGNDVSMQLRTLTLDALLEQFEMPTQKVNLLQVMPAQIPPIASKRFLDNHIHLGTLNYITRLKKDYELRFNTAYINDYQQQSGLNTTEYFLPEGTVVVTENMQNRFFFHDWQNSLTLQKNVQKGYFSNSIKTQWNWDGGYGHILNKNSTVQQRVTLPYHSLSNQFKWITPIGKQLVTLYSNFNYNKAPQRLMVLPGVFAAALNSNIAYNNTQQRVEKKLLQWNNYAEWTRGFRGGTLTAKTGVLYQNQQIASTISTDGMDIAGRYHNDLDYSRTKIYLQPTFIRKTGLYDITIAVPVAYNYIQLNDPLLQQQATNSGITFLPRLNFKYNLNSKWELSGTATFNNDFQSPDRIYFGYLLYNYRTLQQRNYPIVQNKQYNLSPAIRYRDPVSSFFFSTRYNFSINEQPFLTEYEVADNGAQTLSIQYIDNQITRHNIASSLSFYLPPAKTLITVAAEYTYNKNYQLINNDLLKTTNKLINPNLKINTRFSKYISLEYTLQNRINTNQTANQPRQQLYTLIQGINVNLYPSDKHHLLFQSDHYYNDFLPAQQHNIYMDAAYRYTISKKRIDLELRCQNMLNEDQYITPSFTEFYASQNKVMIRPRQLLLLCKFFF